MSGQDTTIVEPIAAPSNPTPIGRLLVANRGEIAVRVIRTARAMGIATVAVFSDADRDALHVARADEAVRLGPAPATESYLNVERVVDAALRSGCDALHPGYGFLSENPALSRACVDAGIVFVGPTAAAMDAMGDKIRAKRIVAAQGVPVVPGCTDTELDDDGFAAAILGIGLPVLLKPSAGGGGKGMRLVEDAAGLIDAIAGSRREALRIFGNGALLAERAVVAPRHIEIQVAADLHGNVVHLGERECSLQRRHQKVIEEAPSPMLTQEMRERMGAQAIAAATACGYTNVGTVEFIVSADHPDEFFFIEMNTRLQVEHPVTEMVTGVDLVELQLRIAEGESLPMQLADRSAHGHAIEARIYAEDPAAGFLPTGGTVVALREPHGPGIRVDTGLRCGTVVGSDYDPMLAKVIAHGSDRAEALGRLDAALGDTSILGVTTNVAWLRALLRQPEVRAGALDTGLIDRSPVTAQLPATPADVLVAAVVVSLGAAEASTARADPWNTRDGWRLGGRAAQHAQVTVGAGATQLIEIRQVGGSWESTLIAAAEGPRAAAGVTSTSAEDVIDVEVTDGQVRTTADGVVRRYDVARDGHVVWLGAGGETWAIRVDHRWSSTGTERAHSGDGIVVSPLPGTLLDVRVAVGDRVAAGQVVATVEAMKMEHPLRAAIAGTVVGVHADPGVAVTLGQSIVEITEGPTQSADDWTPSAGGPQHDEEPNG